MPRYEYKLVPAPEKATKHKGLKGAALFAATLEDAMNALGAEGWHYLRADTLPEEVRSGLTSRTTTYRNILVFQRELPEPEAPAAAAPAPARAEPPPLRTAPPPAAPPAEDADADEDEPSLANIFSDPPAPGPRPPSRS
ncbi:DUF4177 domain-containing protein [Roseicyclus persicicus]|uniref:DUF4177 domain-containing protein n=1 Tax=Roseicyclus persicicus TaxID=2650661 RepID=A0A7X6GYD2_9RHOB|nr:DUF4177 domain-containing protein [Roseibacterium persicicum]NKX44676.1 DUF4177 domain-containing protein [Roseibacterium persicicum]